MAIQYAGRNTIEALIRSAQGDLSSLVNVVNPTFTEVYQNLEELNDTKEEAFQFVTKAQYDALTDEEKLNGNYVVVDENSAVDNLEYVSASDVEAWFNE